MNYLAKLAEWAGRGDHFLGFVRIGIALLVVAVAVFVVINVVALSGIPG